jgi:hypothetical protein
MANDLHEAPARFNVLPDDAVLPSQVTAIILGVSERTTRYTRSCRESKYRVAATASESAISASSAARECPQTGARDELLSQGRQARALAEARRGGLYRLRHRPDRSMVVALSRRTRRPVPHPGGGAEELYRRDLRSAVRN